jgi:uncharacterized protein YggE
MRDSERVVQVVGMATVDAAPNTASVEFTVESTRKSSSEVLNSVAEIANGIFSELKKLKRADNSYLVRDEDINTLEFSVSPTYRWLKKKPESRSSEK